MNKVIVSVSLDPDVAEALSKVVKGTRKKSSMVNDVLREMLGLRPRQ